MREDISSGKPSPIGIDHIAIEVRSVEDALEFYKEILDITLSNRSPGQAEIAIGSQYLILTEGNREEYDTHRHFGLIIDDKELMKKRLHSTGVEVLYGNSFEFLDPWGNRVKIIEKGEASAESVSQLPDHQEHTENEHL